VFKYQILKDDHVPWCWWVYLVITHEMIELVALNHATRIFNTQQLHYNDMLFLRLLESHSKNIDVEPGLLKLTSSVRFASQAV